jgi:endonuclease/exonuclease/phosphatase (EEP) superfamily protein YafD
MSFARLVFTAILGPPVLVVAIACALAAALAQLGRRSLAWDVLAHGAPIYLAGGLVAIAAALLFHDRFRAFGLIAGLAAVVAAGLLMAPEYLRSAGPPVPPGPLNTIKVIQMNIWAGQGGLARPAAWLAAQKPDFVIVEEANRKVVDGLVKATGLHLTSGRSNIIILSREAPVARTASASDFDSPMMMVGAVFRHDGEDFNVLGVHYPWPTEIDRLPQAEAAIRIIRALPADTTILSGDFNSTPWSFVRRSEDRSFGLIRRTRAVFSWPANRGLPVPILPIDHIYAGAGWATVEVERGPNLGSDHYPVVVTLARVAPPPGGPPASGAPPSGARPGLPGADRAPPARPPA